MGSTENGPRHAEKNLCSATAVKLIDAHRGGGGGGERYMNQAFVEYKLKESTDNRERLGLCTIRRILRIVGRVRYYAVNSMFEVFPRFFDSQTGVPAAGT
jgi:hypothetical protein